MARIVTFGEIMLRLSPPGREVFFQSPQLQCFFGGAEANVAVSLAAFGEHAAFVTALPPNAVGDGALAALRARSVDTSAILRRGDRLGINFLQSGSSLRPSSVLYDRAHSAIAETEPEAYDWPHILDGAAWFHVTGITPALGEAPAIAVLDALGYCRKHHVPVSCDLNFRKKLWKWGKKASEVMPEIVKHASLLIANEEDVQQALGMSAEVDVETGSLDPDVYRELAERLFEAYPNLLHVAFTLRESSSADHNGWSGAMASRQGFWVSRKYILSPIVDRVGGGDAFGAGLIFGLRHLAGPQEALEFAVAASALKHTIPGDFNAVSREEVEALVQGNASGRIRR